MHKLKKMKFLAVFLAFIVFATPFALAYAESRAVLDARTRMDGYYRQYIDALEKQDATRSTELRNLYEAAREEYIKLSSQEAAALKEQQEKEEKARYENMSWFSRALDKIYRVVVPQQDKNEMPWWERIAWTVARTVVPAAAVLAFGAFCALPFGWMVVGAIAIGAIAGGGLTFLYENRMNQFRAPGEKKSPMEILRDVTVAGITEGVLAPFNMATAGLAGTFAGAGAKVILKQAATGAALQFAGQTLSSVTQGLTKKAWANLYFKTPEKIAELEKEAEKIIARHNFPGAPPLSSGEKEELDRIMNQIAKYKAQDYSLKDFGRDLQRAAITSVIMGGVGVAGTTMLAQSSVAYRGSMALFKDTSHAQAIARWIVSNPTSFVTGVARARLDKHFLYDDALQIKAKRDTYPPGSAGYEYFDNRYKETHRKIKEIDCIKAGVNSMLTNLATQSVPLAISALKRNLIELPRQRKADIEDRYRAQDELWKEVTKAKAELEKYKSENAPDINKIKNPFVFAKKEMEYNRKVAELSNNVRKLEIQATERMASPEGQARLKEIAIQYDTEVKIARKIELGRLLGEEKFIKAYEDKLKLDPQNSGKTREEIRQLAIEQVRQDYARRASDAGAKLANMDKCLSEYKSLRQGGNKDSSLSYKEIRAIEYQALRIRPSEYKARYIENRVNELKAQGVSDQALNEISYQIYTDADRAMLDIWGSWHDILKHELIARQLSVFHYDESGNYDTLKGIKQLFGVKTPQVTKDTFLKVYQDELNQNIQKEIMPAIRSLADPDDSFLKYLFY